VGNHAARGARQEIEIEWSGLEPRHQCLPAEIALFMPNTLSVLSAVFRPSIAIAIPRRTSFPPQLARPKQQSHRADRFPARFQRLRGALVQDKAMFIRPDNADSARKR
jgi:hypothetical protein